MTDWQLRLTMQAAHLRGGGGGGTIQSSHKLEQEFVMSATPASAGDRFIKEAAFEVFAGTKAP